MLDRFDLLLDEVRQEPLPAPFAAAEEIRRRARLRSQRQAVSAGVAVLAVLGLGAGGLAVVTGPPDPPLPPPLPAATRPSVTMLSTPPLAEIPQRWLLTAEDLGHGPWDPPYHDDGDTEWLEKGWSWDCDPDDGYAIETHPFIRRRLDQISVLWYESDRERSSVWSVDEIIELYETGWAAASVAGVRAAVEQCSQRPAPGMDVAPVYHTITDEGFAGDESLIIQVETYTFEGAAVSPDPWYGYVAVVRVGDVVRTIGYDPGQRAPVPEAADYLRAVAERAVARL